MASEKRQFISKRKTAILLDQKWHLNGDDVNAVILNDICLIGEGAWACVYKTDLGDFGTVALKKYKLNKNPTYEELLKKECETN